ncbi:hypothetical protein ABT131_33800 [Streptomyces sp900105245]|uniref:hypothetical protein n=1 Tax=Streptomyces sp. 900105245 TaxID=3154379 RepID=UPI003318788E
MRSLGGSAAWAREHRIAVPPRSLPRDRHWAGCLGPGCNEQLAKAGALGGRSRRYCSERCRGRYRRFCDRLERGLVRQEARLDATGEDRHRLRSAAYTVAREARRLAAVLDEEAAKPRWAQPAWDQPRPDRGRPAASYTRAALELLNAAHEAMAAAVAAGRAAGSGWAAIAAALEVSEDTAARHYRPGAKAGSAKR